jgi:hypothetical protein
MIRNLPQPSFESRLTSKGGYTFKDPEEDILCKVGALFVRKALAAEKGMDAAAESLEEFPEILFHADSRLDLLDQLDGIVVFQRLGSQGTRDRARRLAAAGGTKGCGHSTAKR